MRLGIVILAGHAICAFSDAQAQSVDRVPRNATFRIVEASPGKGFCYPYILRIPSNAPTALSRSLLVEPNNTGEASDDSTVHLEAAKKLSESGIGGFLSRRIGLPLLIPVFPRPKSEWRIYTHLLDRDTMRIRDGPMRRLDLQLLAMIDDARVRMGHDGIKVHKKVLLTGFSASGAFVNRFTCLHPDRVRAAASGGVNGILMLPVEKIDLAKLGFPLGLADFKQVSGAGFQLKRWRSVPQFIYMGEKDDNDAVQFDDGYDDDERNIVFSVLGEKMQPDRWEHCQNIYRSAGAAVTFRTYKGVGHWTDGKINSEIADFFSKVISR